MALLTGLTRSAGLAVAGATAVLAVAATVLTGAATTTALAQQTPPAAQPEIKQLQLNEPNIKGFLAAQKDLVAITAKLEAAGDTIDEKLQAELDGIAKKNGFQSFADFEEVRANIMMVLAGIDPDNGQYSDPIDLIKKDIEAIKGDKTLSEPDRKQQLDEMNEALKEMQPLKFKENIELVKKYSKQIDEALK